MVKEKLIIKKETATINISGGVVDSIRFTNKIHQAFRVYEGNKIGVAGALGNVNEDEMWEKAIQNLNNNITYDVEVSKNHKEKISLVSNKMTAKSFLEKIKKLIETLNNKFKDFMFSNKVLLEKNTYQLINDQNLDLYYDDEVYSFLLIIKDRSSANLFDALYVTEEREYNEQKVVKDISLILDNYHRTIDFEEGVYPVIFSFEKLSGKFHRELRGDLVASNTSIFSDKIGKQVFNENFSLYLDKNPTTTKLTPFFDFEGVVNKDYRYKIIDKGNIISPYSSKLISKKYNLVPTGSAYGSFDSVPEIEEMKLTVENSGLSLNELLNGQKAIFIVVAEGGSYNSTGNFASPVQLAYLVEDSKIIGRLPNLNVSSNIYDMFNQDYIGKANNSILEYEPGESVIIKMKVSRI